jgi:signal transduction histidine kinase
MPPDKSSDIAAEPLRIQGLSLVQKGLLLVGMLLVLELSFFAVLIGLLRQAEHDIWKQWHSKKVLTQLADLNRSIIVSGSYVYMYGLSKDSSVKAQFERDLNNIPRQLASLKLLYAETPERKIDIAALDASMQQVTTLLARLMTVAEGNLSELNFLSPDDVTSQVKASINKVRSDLERLDEQEKQLLIQAPDAETQSRHGVERWLLAGVALNVVIAIALAILFTKGLTNRLAIVIDNTFRLSKKQELRQPLDGNDEIAYLDRTFHKMANGLEAVERLKQEFMSMITHDLRAPVASILCNLQAVTSGISGDVSDKAKSTIQRSERSCNRLLELINDLLDIDKLESGKFELSLEIARTADIVERAVESVQDLSTSKEIQIETAASDVEVYADADRLVQILVNLISNAIKFAPKKSTVKVSVLEIPGWSEFRVSDQGRGIPASHLKKIFDRFQQVEISDAKVKGGSGLGLAICKAIVEEHKGQLGAESQEGSGSTFWFRIPASNNDRTMPASLISTDSS